MSEQMPRFTPRAQALLDLARQIAERQGHSAVDTEHLLIGMASQNDGAAGDILRALGIDDARQIEGMLHPPVSAAEIERGLAQRMDQYIHDTAHDLKGKVASIKGYADLVSKIMEMLTQPAQSPESVSTNAPGVQNSVAEGNVSAGDFTPKVMEMFSRQAQSLEAISKNADILLDMVNVEARGWLPLAEVLGGTKPRPCDLVKIAGAAVTALDRAKNTPDVGVNFDVPAGDWWVWGYESLLHGTVLSLTNEALRRSEADQNVAITLGSNEGDVWLRINDQGPALADHPANQFASIRLDEEGAVKGVPAAVLILSAHGGKIEARNLPEGGAEMVVLFPKEIVISAGS